MNKRIAFDSCAILHLLCETPDWIAHLRPIYEQARKRELELVISEISVAESVRIKTSDGALDDTQQSQTTLKNFFDQSFIIRRGVTRRESELAAQLVRRDVGACDALIAATAYYAGAAALYTTDGCSRRRKAGKLLALEKVDDGKGSRPPMTIQPPTAPV